MGSPEGMPRPSANGQASRAREVRATVQSAPPVDDGTLVSLAAGGDVAAFESLLARHEARLRCQVRMRLDPRLRRRVDVSDVLQEVWIEAHARLPDYAAKREVPFFVWLRYLTQQRVAQVHRFHFGAHARDARREAPIGPTASHTTSAAMAAELVGDITSPSEAAARAESERALREALDAMPAPDREILCLRHFEQLGNAEAAHELGIEPAAASKRYIRALRRLGEILARTMHQGSRGNGVRRK